MKASAPSSTRVSEASDEDEGAHPHPAPHGVAIIGLGNSLAHDDAAGLEAVRRLRRAAEAEEIVVHEHESSPLALLDLWAGADAVVLVDAIRSGGEPGSIHRFDASNSALPAQLGGSTSTHAVGLGDAVELARELGRLPRRLILLGIEGVRFDAGRGLSAEVEAVLAVCTDAALHEASALRGGCAD